MEEANFREITHVVREGVNLTLVGSKVEDGIYRPVENSTGPGSRSRNFQCDTAGKSFTRDRRLVPSRYQNRVRDTYPVSGTLQMRKPAGLMQTKEKK